MTSLIDTLRVHETPEGVDLELRVAGPAVRAAALAIDSLIRFVLYLALIPLLALSGLGLGLVLLGLFLLEWFYPVFFELRSGTTPGKSAMGLRVVHDDGTPVGALASVIRNLLRVADFLPLFYAAGLVSCLVDRDFRRLGNLDTGILVVHSEPPLRPQGIPERPARCPPGDFELQTQGAVLAFAERCPRLSSGRRSELAEALVGPLRQRGEAAVEVVLGYANWLARGQ